MGEAIVARVVGEWTEGRLEKAGVRGESQQLPEAAWAEAYASGQVVEPPYDLEALAGLYEGNSTHKACVDAKTINIVGLGYRFVPLPGLTPQAPLRNGEGENGESLTPDSSPSEDLGRGENGEEAAEKTRLEHLLNACNPEMTFTEVMRAVWTDVECLGNGYLEITRNSLGEIDGFYHVPGTSVRLLSDRSGFVQIREGCKRLFRAVGQPEVTDPETGLVANEMMHFSKYTPQSSYYGVPDIIPAVPALAGDKAAREYNIDFFSHNAVPRMAIIVEGGQLSEPVVGQLRQFMESEIKGQGHKTLLLETPGLEAKVRLEKLTVGGTEEAGFLQYRKANRDEVLLVHRVPPSKVSVVENANLANSKDQDKTFREQVVRPEQRRIEYKLNRLLHEHVGACHWEFQFREMDLDEEREQAEINAIYAGIGVLSAEEIRGKLGV